MTWSIRLVSILLYFYPRAFRRRYAAEMSELMASARNESRYQGAAGNARFVAFITGDLVVTGLRLRRAQIAAVVRRGRRGGLPSPPSDDLRRVAVAGGVSRHPRQ